MWVTTGCHIANHFLEIVNSKSRNCDEVHVICDRYDIPNSLTERTREVRLANTTNRSVIANNISEYAVTEKVSLKQLLSNQVTKEKLSMYLVSHLCREESDKVFVTTLMEDCKSNSLHVAHLRSNQEEADTSCCTRLMQQREVPCQSASRVQIRMYSYWHCGSTKICFRPHKCGNRRLAPTLQIRTHLCSPR
jgi:hypothetical protein